MEKIDGNESRDRNSFLKKQLLKKEMLKVKNTVTEMKNTFDGLTVDLTLSQWI